MSFSNKSIRVISLDCRALFMGYTSLLKACRAHIRCNAKHIIFKKAHIHSTHILCPKKSHTKKKKDGCKQKRRKMHASFFKSHTQQKKRWMQAGTQLCVVEQKRMKRKPKNCSCTILNFFVDSLDACVV